MIKTSIRKFATAGFLSLGLVGLASPAIADTLLFSASMNRGGVVGTSQSGNIGAVGTVQCALTKVRALTSTTQAAECRLVNVGGQWRLNATVVNAGAAVECEAHCYQ